MTKGQYIEYELVTRAVRATEPDNEGASIRFVQFVGEMQKPGPGIESGDVLSALKRLHSEKVIRLRKSKVPLDFGYRDYGGENDDDAMFFYTGDFRVKETPYSRTFLEQFAPSEEPAEPQKRPIGFVAMRAAVSDKRDVPAWLLSELFLISGVFLDKTTVRGQRNPHSLALANIGNGPPSTEVTVDLTTRADWGAIKKRLADEGF
jgi:hypothetical protein